MSFTLQKNLRKRLKRMFVILIGLYVMIGSALYFFQEKMMFLPTILERDYQYSFNHPFEELFFKTDVNTEINALHFKAKNAKGVLLYFHGNAGDLSRWGKITEFFVDQDYDVLVMDYRTFGKSKGPLSEAALYSDAQYCYDYLLKQYPEDKIVLYGRSLGTGIAAFLASKNKPQQLILETPYYSIADVAQHRFPLFPVKRLLKYRFPTHQYLPNVSCLITIIHGTGDNLVPYASGRKLFDLNLDNLNFVTVEGGKHNDLIHYEMFRTNIQECLK
ncbi:MAG: alpha/beta hydrolase [Winogradskyella sp.]|nr:alpha/beta hydrolase [Winogradskyella sp.]